MTLSCQQEWSPPSLPGLSLVRRIGSGGFGEVWLARHATLNDRLRAVKVVRREAFASTSAFREEFKGLQLYQELSRDSRYLVSIYQVGHAEDFYYYEMDLADDRTTGAPCLADQAAIDAYASLTLTAQVKKEPSGFLPAAECLRLGLALAEGLQTLHDEGFTHRDVKPDNILYVKGVPRLVDIGTMTRGEERRPVEALGYTPAEGAGQPRADIFSLGRTLFFAASGKDPLYHWGSFPEAYYAQDLHDRKCLERVLDRATQHLPKARYPSIHAMREALDAVVPEEGASRGRLGLWFAGGVVLLLAFSAIVFMGWPWSPAPVKTPVQPTAGTMEPTEPKAVPTPEEHGLRVLVVSRTGRDVEGAELCVGTESHAVNWNDPDHWVPADHMVKVWSGTSLYLSVRAPGYTPLDVEAFSVESPESGGMPHLVNVALAAKPGKLAVASPWRLYRHGTADPLSGNGSGTIEIEPEQHHFLEIVHPSVHALRAWELFVVPGKTYALPFARADLEEGTPVIDRRVRAPWKNSLGMSFVHVGEVCPDLLWSVYETRLSDFRVFCEDTGRPSVAYDTNLWDARKDERAFMERLNAEERRRYESLEPPEQRARFMEGHSLASERQARLSHPVTKATFVEIEAFAQWLTLRERERGGLPPHLAYRLPTDLEWSAAVGASEGGRVSDPEQSGLTLLNLVEAEVLSREALSQRGFRMGNLGNVVVTPTVLESLEPATRSLILHAVKRQQLKMRIDRARRASPLFPVTAAIHVASDDTLPVQHTASNALGLHGLEGNVSEVMYDSRDFYQMVLRGPSFYTRAVVDDPTSAMNLKTRMLASKEVRNLSFGFRLVLAPERSEKVP